MCVIVFWRPSPPHSAEDTISDGKQKQGCGLCTNTARKSRRGGRVLTLLGSIFIGRKPDFRSVTLDLQKTPARCGRWAGRQRVSSQVVVLSVVPCKRARWVYFLSLYGFTLPVSLLIDLQLHQCCPVKVHCKKYLVILSAVLFSGKKYFELISVNCLRLFTSQVII